MYPNTNTHSRTVFPILVILVISLFLMTVVQYQQATLGQQSTDPTTTTAALPVVSARNHFNLDTGELNPGHNDTDYNTTNNIPGLQTGSCPPEIAIYVHGVWANEREANEQLDRVKLSLDYNHYIIPLIGFSWDSNTEISPHGWVIAKIISNQNGPKFAHFISNFKDRCQSTNIRIIGHSLGASVVNSTLVSLNNNSRWKNSGFTITSVHLLAAAINSDTPSINTPFGAAIERVVNKFYIVYDPKDDLLSIDYPANENHAALGLIGADFTVIRPRNYIQQNVANDLQLSHANGTAQIDCLDYLVPPYDNHCGYIGFRDLVNLNSLRSDGVIGIVVADWKGVALS